MSIKRKLLIILVLIGLIYSYIIGIVIYNSILNIHQIKIIRTNIDNMNAITGVRVNINKQIDEALQFIITGDHKDKDEFEKIGKDTIKEMEKWIDAERRSSIVGSVDKGQHLNKSLELKDKYIEYTGVLRRTFEVIGEGENRDEKTLKIVEDNFYDMSASWIGYVLLEEMDDIIYEEIDEINKVYNILLINIGSLPWIANRSMLQVNIAKKSIYDYITIDTALYSINKQIKEAEEYILTGNIDNKNNFEEYGLDVKKSLKEWTKSTQLHQIKDNKEYEEIEKKNWDSALELGSRYHQILELLDKGMELREKGEKKDAYNFIEELIMPSIENLWIPQIERIINDNKQIIEISHKNLIKLMFYAELQLIIIFAIVLLVTFITLIKMIKGMISSLNKIIKGTKTISSGDLNYQIDINSNDEIGELAFSFNQMALDLQKSRGELIKKHEELSTLFNLVERGKKEWEETMDCIGDMVIITDNNGKIKRCNKAFVTFTGKAYKDVLSKTWKDLLYKDETEIVTSEEHGTEIFHKPTERWFVMNSYPFQENSGEVVSVTVITIHDYTKIKTISKELEAKNIELKNTQSKVLQQEKMASIGQLAAGVAHEINNPIGFISSNLGTLDKYIQRLTDFIITQSEIIGSVKDEAIIEELKDRRKKLKLDYILEDIKGLITESLDGTSRVRKIVQDLKTFSRVDESDFKHADINECIETTINIIWNELKYKTTLKKEYGDIPHTKCYPQQLNQVFMNIMINAAHAIEKHGEICIKTWHKDGSIFISLSDTGSGIPKEILDRIFEPFFTTKEVGKGTGLGLSITYDIVKKHNGEITVESEIGKGTTFTIKLPVIEGK